jgi:hypothetical protein
MMNVFVLAILIYLLYRFTAGFLIPVFRAGNQMRRQFRNMNQPPPDGSQDGNARNQTPDSNGTGQTGKTPGSSTSKVGEYIDFEEVK